MTFVVYLFALSVFFFSLRNVISSDNACLDVSGELMFDRIDQIYDDEYDFLDNSKLDIDKFNNFFLNQGSTEVYNYLFKDFENIALFERIDYCVYLIDTNNAIFRNYVASKDDNPVILLEDTFNPPATVFCGEITDGYFTTKILDCPGKAESIVLTKSVIHNNAIIDLKVFICAEKR